MVGVAAGGFAPGHLGELTRIMPFEMVDAVLAQTGAQQRRVRALPSRVVVYLLLAGGLFGELGYGQVWARMIAGLYGLSVATRGECAGPGPSPDRGRPATGTVRPAPRPRSRDVDEGCVLAGPAGVCGRRHHPGCPDTAANLAVYHRGGGEHGGTGYPLVRVLALVACGTRTIIDAISAPTGSGRPATPTTCCAGCGAG